jgi:PAS domain S-box-containing protein
VRVSGRDSITPVGIQRGDFLIDINGLSIRSVDEYTEIIEALSSGSVSEIVADYTFRRTSGSGPEEATFPLRISLESQFSRRDTPLVIVAFSFLAIGVFTLLRSSSAPGAFHFSLVTLVAFILMLFRHSGRADPFDVAVYWFSAVTFLVLPPLFLHFCVSFPRRHPWVKRLPYLLSVLYMPAVLLSLVHLAWFTGELRVVGLPRNPLVGHFLDRVELLHFAVYFVIASLVLVQKRQLDRHPVHRKPMEWIAAGTCLGLAPFGIIYVVPFLLNFETGPWMEASILSLILLPLSFGYAITKFRLHDVDLIFKRGVAYVIASSTLLALYVGMALLIARAVQDFSPGSDFLFLAISALAVAFFFAPFKNKIQEQLDRYFYKERYSYRRSFLDFGRTLGSEINLHRLTEKISDRLRKTLDLEAAVVFLRDHAGKNLYILETPKGLRNSGIPAVLELSESELIGLSGGSEIWEQTPATVDGAFYSAKNRLREGGIRYIEPLGGRGRIIGFIGLSRRRSGDLLNSEDLEMVQTLSRYAAIAIDNARLYHSLETKADELIQLRIYSENVIESINLGVAVISTEGNVTVWNSAMETVTGISKGSAVGKEIVDLLAPSLVESLDRVLDDSDWLVSDVRRLYKAHLESRDGYSRLINVTLSPFISYQNVNTGTLLVFDDITDKIRLENQLQQAEKLSSIGLFAAGLAHEVNTPLAGISSYAQMLLEDKNSADPNYDLLKKIEKQSFRASEIVNNLLSFARFSSSEFEEVNINSLMLDTLSLLEHQLKRGEIEVSVDFSPTIPKTVGNGGKIQQVFMNIFLNAKDSMPEGGEIKLRTFTRGSELVIEVRDNGEGISEEDIKRIYDPFFTTKSVGKGTGLGLSVSYGIIQEHSGRISVESELGRGTTFSLYLPLRRVN